MASVIAGRTCGVTKNSANIIAVKYHDGSKDPIRAASLFQSLLWILDQVIKNGQQGKAVINFSTGKPIPLVSHH